MKRDREVRIRLTDAVYERLQVSAASSSQSLTEYARGALIERLRADANVKG